MGRRVKAVVLALAIASLVAPLRAEMFACKGRDGTTYQNRPCDGEAGAVIVPNPSPAELAGQRADDQAKAARAATAAADAQKTRDNRQAASANEAARLAKRVFMGYRCDAYNRRPYMSQEPCPATTTHAQIPVLQTPIYSTVGCEEAKSRGDRETAASLCRQ